MDITPTWRALLPTLVDRAVNAKSAEARKAALDALYRLADAADELNAELKSHPTSARQISIALHRMVNAKAKTATKPDGQEK